MKTAMRKIIIAQFTDLTDLGNDYKFFAFDEDTVNYLWADEAEYAIVNTNGKLRLVRVYGFGAERDKIRLEQGIVVSFLRDADVGIKHTTVSEGRSIINEL